MFDVIPLGTGSATPTATRHLSGTVVRRAGRLFLFDCGEGTQFQLLRGGLVRSRLDAVFVTHLHGDHVFGLPGLLTTLAMLERTDPLTVVGPAGLPAMLDVLPGLRRDGLPFALHAVELADGFGHEVVYEDDALTVEARPLEHRVFCAGYRLQERTRPGHLDGEGARAAGITEGRHFEALKRGEDVALPGGIVVRSEGLVGPERPGAGFAYVLDTVPCDGGRALAADADLLMHEATFAEDLAARAAEVGHSTARQAATVARDAGARHLLLTHFSARYTDVEPLVDEARAVFPNTDAALELVPFSVRRPEPVSEPVAV